MLDYSALAALAEVIRRGSFDAAAQALSVTPSAISQRIRALEDRQGAVLVDRGPPVRGTDAGQRLAAHLDRVRLLEAELEGGSGLPPVIRIAVNADSLAIWAMPPLSATPGLVDLVIDDQDHALHWLRTGQVMAAVTGEARPVTGCDSIPLGRMRYRATASHAFAEAHFGAGISDATLAGAPSLRFNRKDGLQDRWAMARTGARLALRFHHIPSSQGFAEATRQGLGWGMNPEAMIAGDIAAGRVVDLAPDLPLDVPLYWQVTRTAAGPLASLTAAMRQAARGALLPPG